ncbi:MULTISPECIES: DUF885 domain-containing protein [unclassified Brevibacterium]|uniref:DUF885 domain-containing protein n=1 Tax=unclassified Brevibacterium TaxID=2614124 RepID=UPI001092CFCD|nr:DUF885 domain-containing protein [Brevibacterium sp. S22]TGD30840.1 DUF885 domain-containing protein [Brevibacterium sp. S22]
MASHTEPTSRRNPSPIDAIADAYFDELCVLSPSISLFLGTENPHGFDDYSPEGLKAANELRARTLALLDDAEADGLTMESLDETDLVTIDAMRERLDTATDLFEAGLQHTVLNVIESPVQQMRDIFDLLPTDTEDEWETVSRTMAALPRSIDGYRESLRYARDELGRVPARLQIERVAAQAEVLSQADSRFTTIAADATSSAAETLARELTVHAESAREAFGGFARFLRTELTEHAPENEACGREDYALFSREFLGAEVDLEETYEWALDELDSIDAEQRRVANIIHPGVELFDVMRMLDSDPQRALHGTKALQEWMQTVADEAITELGKTHFDIPEPLRTIECMIAPSATGAVYYSQPSEDFSRPGRMWWSVPDGVTEFATWQEKTTVYHEGVPGHHLQMGQASYLADSLNQWRRHVCWVSGHGEGWALYAERLMAELGFLDEPGDYLGMLDSQRLRTSRVIVDIGFHLGLKAPDHLGGGTWDRATAWEFLTRNVAMDRTFLAFELDRYLGWPGQAPSYKIGQRLWEDIRDGSRAVAGAGFDLKEFHSRALGLGSIGLDPLRRALLR